MDTLPKSYKEWRKCYFCQTSFIEKDNIGFLNCSIHPGIIIYKNNLRYYSCCGSLINSKNFHFDNKKCLIRDQYDKMGCLPIDHFDQDHLIEKGIISISQRKLKNDNDDITYFSSDLNEKIQQIKLLSYIIIPEILYKKGLSKPIYLKTILAKIDGNKMKEIKTKLKQNVSMFGDHSYIQQYNLNIQSNAYKNYSLEYPVLSPNGNNIEIDLYAIIKQLKENFKIIENEENSSWKDNINTDKMDLDQSEVKYIKQDITFYIVQRISSSLTL
jgi:hypothetical protein